jgi:glycosidase
MLQRAQAQGIANFHIFGEVATSELDSALLARATRVDRLPSVLDFAFRAAALGTLTAGAGTDTFVKLFDGDALYEGGTRTSLRLPTFVSNHDTGRFAHFARAANPRASDAEILKRTILAHALMFTLRGVPVIYAGDEQGFAGDGNDADGREDMFASAVADYNDNVLIGTQATTAQPNFDRGHPLFKAIARLARIRRDNEALRRGEQIIRNYADTPGLFAVSRIDPRTRQEILLVFNTGTTPIERLVETDPGTVAFAALDGECAPAPTAPGSYRVRLDALSYVICKGM